jgi:hypothetical protein
MWLSLAVPPALLVIAVLLQRLESSLLPPLRAVTPGLVEDHLDAGAASDPLVTAAPRPETIQRPIPARDTGVRRLQAVPPARTA